MMVLAANPVWKAIYYDGSTARRHEVTVVLNESGMNVTLSSGQSLWWLYENLRIAQGYHAGEPTRVETRSELPEAIVVETAGFLDAFVAFAPKRDNFASSATERMNRSAPMILGSVAAAVILLFMLWRWGIPAFADVVARGIPSSVENDLGKSVVAQFAPPDARCTNPKALLRINEIVARLQSHASAATPISVTIANLPIANAFAAPGGYVVVFRGLLEQTQNAEDLAGVLAHEIQHIEQHHATRGIVRQLSLASLLAIFSGNASGMRSVMDAAAMVGSMKYQREDEESADFEAVRMMQTAGIDAAGLPRMLDRMSRKDRDADSGVFEYLSSHPATAERVRKLRELAASQPAPAKPLSEGYDWGIVALMCKDSENSKT